MYNILTDRDATIEFLKKKMSMDHTTDFDELYTREPYYIFSECVSEYCKLNRTFDAARNREKMEDYLVQLMTGKEDLNVTFFGCGYLFTELVLLNKFRLKTNIKKLKIVLVDYQYKEYIHKMTDPDINPAISEGVLSEDIIYERKDCKNWLIYHTRRLKLFLDYLNFIGFQIECEIYGYAGDVINANISTELFVAVDLLDDFCHEIYTPLALAMSMTSGHGAFLDKNVFYIFENTPNPLFRCEFIESLARREWVDSKIKSLTEIVQVENFDNPRNDVDYDISFIISVDKKGVKKENKHWGKYSRILERQWVENTRRHLYQSTKILKHGRFGSYYMVLFLNWIYRLFQTFLNYY